MPPRIFSGIQPTGELHLGNFFGAVGNWIRLQSEMPCVYCVVDYHAITVEHEPAQLRANALRMAGDLLACGIDPAKAILFIQSDVPEHTELAWVLSAVASFGDLSRMTQFKEKGERQSFISAGLFTYPVLQAADILAYKADRVPVGDDQSQHLELTRDVAQRFNALYGDTFVMPATKLPTVGARIMGLDDPTKKMSKSTEGPGHAISLLDPPSVIKKKIMRATTDSQPCVDFHHVGPGVENLLTIHQAFTGWTEDQVKSHFAGMRYGDLKKQVAEAVVAGLEPLQTRYAEIMADPGYLHGVLRESADRVAPIAEATVRLVKERMGIYVG